MKANETRVYNGFDTYNSKGEQGFYSYITVYYMQDGKQYTETLYLHEYPELSLAFKVLDAAIQEIAYTHKYRKGKRRVTTKPMEIDRIE